MSMGAIVATTLLLVANGFFVAVEFALVGSRRSKLQALADDGNRRATGALDAAADLTLQLAGAQLGITMASLALGFVAKPAIVAGIDSLLGPVIASDAVRDTLAFIVGLGIVVFLHLVIGEMVPKGIALADPENTLVRLNGTNRVYLRGFSPVIRLLNTMAAIITRRAFGVEPRDELAEARTAEEFAVMLAESHDEGVIEDFAHELLTGVLDFGGRRAGSVMVPRASVAWVPATDTVAAIEHLVVDRGHSRVLVTGAGGIDNYLGFVHSKDLLFIPEEQREFSLPPRLVRQLLKVDVELPLESVLMRMRSARVHVAVVLGADDTVVGILTLEDLLEELVGEILDETDDEEQQRG